MKKLHIFLALLTATCLCVGCGGQKQTKSQGLVLKAAPDVTVSLSSGFENGEAITPDKVVEEETRTCYYYAGLSGAYRCTVTGTGYYSLTKNIVITPEQGELTVDVTPGKMANAGWEPQKLTIFADTLLDGALSDDTAQWPDYAEVFASPYYTEEHPDHQITTQAQMESYLAELDAADNRMYLYSAGTSSTYMQDIPIAVFTQADLSAAKNLEQAAQAMGKDKPTVLIRAQMHGNEPAGGEAALALIKWLTGSLGDELLDKINVCVIPRQNPDGAQAFVRTVKGGIDPNRDCMQLQSQEITGYVEACRWLTPAIIVDDHEYTVKTEKDTLAAGDILVQTGITVDNTEAYRTMNLELAGEIFAAMGENGLDYRYYSDCASALSTSISGGYASKQGSLYILLESRGIGGGLSCYSRRIISHVISIEAILRYAAENAQQVMETVDEQRQTIIEKGSKYDPTNVVALKVTSKKAPELELSVRNVDQKTGAVTETTQVPVVYSEIERSRIAPTAYVIPAGEGFVDNVLALMDKHGIAYTELPKGSTVQLQQYTESGGIFLTDETAVTFPDGAYVFCRNQIGGLLLANLMEPDVDIEEKRSGTFVQQGVIRATDGKFPLYRYIRDLNADGFIDYR